MYNLKIVVCDQRIEIYKVINYAINEKRTKEEFYRFVNEELEEGEERKDTRKTTNENRIDTLNKARNNIIRLIKCNSDMNVFLTLTFAKESNYKESKKYLNNLFNKLRRDYKGLKYLWVLEYGENGTHRLHYHVLTNIPIDINLSTSKEYKTKEHKELEQKFKQQYWKYGFVDIRKLNDEGNTNVALYVSSYIVKSMKDISLNGYRIYGYSYKTMDKPKIYKSMDKRTIEEILNYYSNLGYKMSYSNSYDVGYTKDGKTHKGKVAYFDFEKGD